MQLQTYMTVGNVVSDFVIVYVYAGLHKNASAITSIYVYTHRIFSPEKLLIKKNAYNMKYDRLKYEILTIKIPLKIFRFT